MKIAFNPSTVEALTTPPNNKDITFDLRGHNIFARGVKFCGTDTNTWRDIKINNVSIGSNTLNLRDGSNTTLTNTNGVVTINSTWRPVVDNLTSNSTTSSLSAKQGKVLKSLIDGKSNSGHTHDDRYLKLTGGTMQLGEGLKFHADDNYFGAYADARIISLLDCNYKICDGGLIIDERGTFEGKEYVTELLRIRDSEFKWKGSNILHSGNSNINGNTITINGSSLMVSKSDHTHSNYVTDLGTNGNYLTWVKNGSTNNITVPYATTSSYLTNGFSAVYTNKWDCNAPDRVVYSDYGSSGRSITNTPSGWNYGTLLELGHTNYRGLNGQLNILLMWDVAHNTTLPGTLWFRGKDSINGWAKSWAKVITDLNISSILSNYYTKSEADGKYVTLTTTLTIGGSKTFTTGIKFNTNKNGDANLGSGDGFKLFYNETSGSNFPGYYYNVASFITGYTGFLLACYGGYDLALKYRHRLDNGTWHPWKTLAFTTDIPSSLKNPYALTISLNGTSQGPYDGSAAKNINITPSSIGAATSDHNHDGRYLRWNGSTADISAMRWGTLIAANGYTILSHAASPDGGDMGFVNKGGQIFMLLDGYYYQNEGRYRVLDTSDAGSLSVNYANSAGNADTVDGYHASGLWRSDGATWNPNANISLTANGNNQEWSFDIRRNGYTGCYWHVWDSARNTMLKVNADNGKVYAPYNFVGNLEGNASTATKLTSSAGNAALPIYFSDGKPVACTASSVFSNLSNSGNNLSITVAGQNRTLTVGYASSAGSATKVIVNLNTTNDTNYPLVWSNLSNTNSVTENQLYKSWSDLYYNPKNKKLTVEGSVEASSFVKIGGTSLQLLRADGGIATFNWSGQSGLPTWLWGGNNLHSYYVYNPSNFRVAYAASAGNADTLDGYHASDFASSSHSHNYAANENYGGFTKSGRLPISGFYQSEESESGGNAPWSSLMHLINCLHSTTGNNYALLIAASFFDNNTFKIRVTNNDVNNDWKDIIHSGNIGSQTVANAYHLRINSANTWSTWYWAGLSGQPSWLWGSNDGTNMYVWDPNNFNVNTALYLRSLGNLNCQTGRTLNYGDVYSYNTITGNTGSPTEYSSVIGFGRGIAGTVEIAGGWCNTGLYWRSLRDCCEDWYSWRTVLDSSNYTGFVDNYYWANVKISTSSSTTTSPTVDSLTALSYIKMGKIYLLNDSEINCASGLYLNFKNSANVSLCEGGGNVGIGTTSPTYKLDVNGLMRASGFHHSSMNSDNYILLAGGGYKSFGGDSSHPVFLGYLNLDHGSDGTVSSSFYCLGYSVPFTYTRGGNYCKISIPDTSYQTFYIKAAIASVNYSGGGMDAWTGYRRGDGAWWLHCYAYGSNEVRVKGFRLANDTNDSWWGGNPLWSSNGGANKITVCIFGYVTFK